MLAPNAMHGTPRALPRGGFLCAALLILVFSTTGCASSDSSQEAGEAPETGAAQKDSLSSTEASNSADEEDKSEETKPAKKKRKERNTSVQVAKAYEGDLIVPVVAEGTIRARHHLPGVVGERQRRNDRQIERVEVHD